MPSMPDHQQQILAIHGQFVRQLVEACQTPGRERDVATLLQSAQENGWERLVSALRQIVSGRRDLAVLNGLDEEDQVIAEAVLRGLQNPGSLPPAAAKPEPALAAPGLAGMIRAAATGNLEALQLVSNMAEQMSRVGGDMARVAGIMRPLINGERDPDRLTRGMSAQGRQLVAGLLEELSRHEIH
jgi:hypothetical protein